VSSGSLVLLAASVTVNRPLKKQDIDYNKRDNLMGLKGHGDSANLKDFIHLEDLF